MPFLSFLPAIKYFGHFQNPDTFVVDIYLLSAVDFAMGIGRCVNDDLLNELMQDTRCQLRDIGVLADNGQKPVKCCPYLTGSQTAPSFGRPGYPVPVRHIPSGPAAP